MLKRSVKIINAIAIVCANYSVLRSTPQLLLVAENDGFVCGIVEIVSFPQVRPVDLPSPIRPDQQTEPAAQAFPQTKPSSSATNMICGIDRSIE